MSDLKVNVKNATKGFTLLEIMIVISIIGVLAALGIPAITKSRENAKINSFTEI